MHSLKIYCVLLLMLLLSNACTPIAHEPDLIAMPDSPFAIHPTFFPTWQAAGGVAQIGLPLSAPLWLNGQLVQYFEHARLEAQNNRSPLRTNGNVTIHTHTDDWQTRIPAEVLTLEPAPQRAQIILERPASNRGMARVGPLQPVVVRLTIADYAGPAELQLYDAHLRLVDTFTPDVQDGQAEVNVLPRGAPGPQWALAVVAGQLAGASSALFNLEPETDIQTGWAELDALYPTVRGFMEQCVVSYKLDGTLVRGYRSPDNPLLWLRDHVYQGRGFRYFERDVTSLLDAFARAQFPDGSFPDVLAYPSRGSEAKRMDTESDLEFLFVQGVYDAWQMTGDDDWLRTKLEPMRRGLAYITSDPLRWDATHQLVRRPYTIDTWDFEYGPTTISPDGKPAPRHWIDEQTIWGIFHGDNTGLAYAMELLARMEEHLGDTDAAAHWRQQGQSVMQRLNTLSWNGSFFTHFVPLEGPLDAPGVDTDAQLSLSNAYALNREVLRFRQGYDIVGTYYQRRDFERAFAEWYSIDPPFPEGSFGMGGAKGERPGEYVNGGIMPLVGGELARGAFRYGLEPYGFDILARYATLVDLSGTSYLWYYPTDGSPGISSLDTLATDGWGSSAMLGALIEGAAGIEDRSRLYRNITLSPRWSAAPDVNTARVVARYGPSAAYVAYTWQRTPDRLHLTVTGTWEQARLRLLLPEDAGKTVTLLINGAPAPTTIEQLVSSRYVVLDVTGGDVELEVGW